MVKTKNILNLNPKVKTFNKSITSRRPLDGISKNEKVSNIEKPILKSVSSLKMANEMIRKEKLPRKENIKVEKEIILKKEDKIKEVKSEVITEIPDVADQTEEESSSMDNNRRLFFKVAGVAGLGLAASALFPKGADAYVSGSTPTSNVVGVKNVANTKINPATEDGNLATVATNTTSLAGKDFATQTTLDSVKTNTDNLSVIKTNTDNLVSINSNIAKFKFDGDNLLISGGVGGGGGGYEIVGLKDLNSNRVNPSTEESLVLLRRMVKIMESQSTVDFANRQRITIDAIGTGTPTALGATIPVSGSLTTAGTVSTVTTVTSVTNMVTLAGQNQQMYQDPARNAYANGIRQNLSFT
jgi:hypothetical protein